MLTDASVSSLVLYARDLEASRSFYGQTLGLSLLKENASSATYAAGGVSLEIRSTVADKITLASGRDDTSLTVFHVNNLDQMRDRLAARGILFGETLRYEIGATVAFYDPDGHNLTLYQPSEESMTWPSARKIRELVGSGVDSGLLRDSPVIYLFLFIRDAKEAFDFYHGKLGLRVLEDDPDAGVVKYDCQNIILATHVVGGDARCAVDMDLSLAKGVAAAFSVEDTEATFRQLSGNNIPFRQFEEHPLGSAYFKDPNGHPIFVRSTMTNAVTETAPAYSTRR
jgi:catechol 2,3-dioxygenase-like lactoylglutathione lyase family enzyme